LLTATVLFTDLRDFTTAVQQTEPERLMGWLGEYTEAVSQQILARGGVIHEYVGDAILATFGVPVPRKSPEEVNADARAAVETAIAMASTLGELNKDWIQRGLPKAEMRVGVDTGLVVGGSLGSRDRLKYAVVGDTVVAASRLESLEKSIAAPESSIPHCRILISDATWSRLNAAFEGRCLGPFILKGWPVPVTIHHVFAHARAKERL
jgi:adenylate cyclase